MTERTNRTLTNTPATATALRKRYSYHLRLRGDRSLERYRKALNPVKPDMQTFSSGVRV